MSGQEQEQAGLKRSRQYSAWLLVLWQVQVFVNLSNSGILQDSKLRQFSLAISGSIKHQLFQSGSVRNEPIWTRQPRYRALTCVASFASLYLCRSLIWSFTILSASTSCLLGVRESQYELRYLNYPNSSCNASISACNAAIRDSCF